MTHSGHFPMHINGATVDTLMCTDIYSKSVGLHVEPKTSPGPSTLPAFPKGLGVTIYCGERLEQISVSWKPRHCTCFIQTNISIKATLKTLGYNHNLTDNSFQPFTKNIWELQHIDIEGPTTKRQSAPLESLFFLSPLTKNAASVKPPELCLTKCRISNIYQTKIWDSHGLTVREAVSDPKVKRQRLISPLGSIQYPKFPEKKKSPQKI